MSYFDYDIGNLDEFLKQEKICDRLELEIVGPVYKAWNPQRKVSRKILNSNKLKHISTYGIFLEVLRFEKDIKS